MFTVSIYELFLAACLSYLSMKISKALGFAV